MEQLHHTKTAAPARPPGKAGTRSNGKLPAALAIEPILPGLAPVDHLEFSVTKFTVSPEWARQVLDENGFDGQRFLRPRHVAYLALEVERREFVPGTPIGLVEFADRTFLVDGQHRLSMVATTGIPQAVSLIRYHAKTLDEVRSVYSGLDRGLPRHLTDLIRVNGIPAELDLTMGQTNALKAGVGMIDCGFAVVGWRGPRTKSGGIRIALMREWADAAQRYFVAVGTHDRHDIVSQKLYSGAIAGVGFYTIRHVGERAERFWEGVAQNSGLVKGSPERALIQFLINDAAHTRHAPPAVVARAAAAAWNAAHANTPLFQVKPQNVNKPLHLSGTPREYQPHPERRSDSVRDEDDRGQKNGSGSAPK